MFLSENCDEIESINENDYFAPKTLLNHQNLYGKLMLFPDLAISDDYQSSNSTKHTLSLTETLNSFYDYIAHISLTFKEKLLLSPISIKNMYTEHSLISGMPIFIFWSSL